MAKKKTTKKNGSKKKNHAQLVEEVVKATRTNGKAVAGESFTPELADNFIKVLKRYKAIDYYDLGNLLECPPYVIDDLIVSHQDLGFGVAVENMKVSLARNRKIDKSQYDIGSGTKIKFGIASDLHMGSKACQITRLHQFCEICAEEGVNHILCPGDITAGYKVYKGQEVELFATHVDDQVDCVIENLPRGFEWYLLGGNHDMSFQINGGIHPLRVVDMERDDCHFIGDTNVDIGILEGVDAKLWHPTGANTLTRSYKIQKMTDLMTGEELSKLIDNPLNSSVRVLLAGHYHQNLCMISNGNILALMCGAFEGENGLTKRMGVTPNIGGYILSIEFSDAGGLLEYTPRFWCRPAIEDDWKNYVTKKVIKFVSKKNLNLKVA